jgi:heavy metal efflux system protein
MLNNIIAFSIKNKLIIGLGILFLIGYGIYQFTQLPIDAVPDITDNQVQVITNSPALGAPDVERFITFPIEQVNSNIPGLKEIRSFSRFGLSVVTIVFEDKVDVYWARQQVTERLQQVQQQIPQGFGTPVLAPVTTGLGEIYQYTIRPKKGYENRYDATELRTIQDWIVRRQLLGVKGVAEVSSFGGNLKQYEVAVDPTKLKAFGLTINEIFTALEQNNQNTGGAYIEKGPTVLFIRSEGLVNSFEDIQNIVVKNLPNGTPLHIRNVAEVGFGSATRYGAMTYNGKNQVSGAVVMMLKGENSNEVIKNIKNRIEQIKKTLPEGVMIDPFLDRTKMVNNAISTVSTNLLEGALIVVFVLVLFLGNFRAGLLVASVIPLAMLFAIILMNFFGVSGNLMSLGALDFGLIVDGAVIIVEAVMHSLALKSANLQIFNSSSNQISPTSNTQQEMDVEVKNSASRMMNSAVFGQIIILIVYLPIFTLQGIEGKMFKPMAQTVAFALLGAFLLSLTYIPMMSALFLSKKIKHEKNLSDRIMERIENGYQKMLLAVMNFPKTIVFSTVVLFAFAVLLLTNMGGEFIPSLPEGDFAVETRVLSGSNLKTSTEAVSAGSKILLANFPEVIKVVGKTGSSEVPTDPMPIEASDMMIILKDKKQWTSASNYDELSEKMTKALEAVPGVTFGFQYPVQMRFNELMTGARQDVVCKIFGENLDTLALYAQKLGDLSHSVDGTRDLYVEAVTGMPQIVVKYNRAAIAQYGLTINGVNQVLNTAFAGQTTGLVFEEEKRFDLVVRLSGEQRKDLQDVQNLLISCPNGAQIPLNQVAKVSIEEGPSQIQRDDAQRRIVVGFNVRGRDVQSIVQELQAKTAAQIKLPAGYYVTYGGAFENLEAAKKRLGLAVPISLLLIFLMLYFAFNSMRQGLLIYSAIPLSAIGGILALALRDMPFSISAGIGFIALFGVSVLNGIVLIAEFNRLHNEGWDDLKQIVIEGTKARLRPVLMTATVASLGFLPMALSTGEGAEVQRPLATVVIGGLLIATFLTLFVLPILYVWFEKKVVKNDLSKTTLLLVFFLFGIKNINAQHADSQLIDLQKAIETGLQNNLNLRTERLKVTEKQTIEGSTKGYPKTNFGVEMGQFNSRAFDTRWSVHQPLPNKNLRKANAALLQSETEMQRRHVALNEQELKVQIRETYYEILFLLAKKSNLQRIDSLYAENLRTAEIRVKTGESGILEKITAEAQRQQNQQNQLQLTAEIQILQTELQYLLQTDQWYLPEKLPLRVPLQLPLEVSNLQSTPQLLILSQQITVAQRNIEAEKTQFKPEFSVGYALQSIRGTQTFGTTDYRYNSVPQFSALQLGVQVPLSKSGLNSRVEAAKIKEQIAVSTLNANTITLQHEYALLAQNYQKTLQNLSFYEKTALPQVQNILRVTDLSRKNGEIGYAEWSLSLRQYMETQEGYLEALQAHNRVVLDLMGLFGR